MLRVGNFTIFESLFLYQPSQNIKKRKNLIQTTFLIWNIYRIHYFLCSCTVLIILSTTLGSARVLVSPNWSSSPAKIFLNILLIILPDRVLGKSSTMMIRFGAANGPIALRTWRINSFESWGVPLTSSFNETKALTARFVKMIVVRNYIVLSNHPRCRRRLLLRHLGTWPMQLRFPQYSNDGQRHLRHHRRDHGSNRNLRDLDLHRHR